MPGYHSTLVASQIDGTAVTTTSEGSLLPTVSKIVLPSNYLGYIGKRLHVVAGGRISNIVTTPGTLILKFMLGPTGNIAVATSTAIQLNAAAKTSVQWYLDLDMVVRAVGTGTTATIMAEGVFFSESIVGAGTGAAGQTTVQAGGAPWQAATPVVGTGFDSGVANQIDLRAVFSLTGNSITCHQFALEDLTTML